MTLATEFEAPRVSRRRRRKSVILDDPQQIADRVIKFFEQDDTDRNEDIGLRLQRYAKLRMWRDEPKDWPWPDASDAAIPDMAEQSYRTQDTLHNAVMSQHPVVTADGLSDKDADRAETIDDLLDFQFFHEQDGETTLAALIQAFTDDGVFTAYIPWIRETRDVQELKIFDPIPPEVLPVDYFKSQLAVAFPKAVAAIQKADGWDWALTFIDDDGEEDIVDVHFYTKADGRVEMSSEREVEIFDGPRVISKEYQDVIYPARVANLMTPGPSNPGGAPHVILRDYPSVDEIVRLVKDGTYDLPGDTTKKDFIDRIRAVSQDHSDDEVEDQKDVLTGVTDTAPITEAASQGTLTRLMCFDLFDVDNDGKDEDVIWWVLRETKTLLRARRLTEMYPALPPRRPFAEANYLPTAGRRQGLGMLELVEGLHDLSKQIFDQTIDAGTISSVPFGFYRPQGAMKPEVIRMIPGELYPLGDPKKDQDFPQIGNNNQSLGINLITVLRQLEERLTMQGDIQFGRVPPGRSSALRTVGGISLLTGQGEARPERVMRRLFIGLTQIYRQMHALNTVFLPKNKQIRLLGPLEPGKNPFVTIGSREEITGDFRFSFKANVLNTSKSARQDMLAQFGQIAFTELGFQTGTAQPDGFFRWQRDIGLEFGLEPDQYITPPSPEDRRRKILAEEAIHDIIQGAVPDGEPLEGAIVHMQRLMAFANDDGFGLLGEEQVQIFGAYLNEVREKAQAEQQQQALLAAAPQFQAGGQDPGGRPGNPQGDPGNPPVQGAELLDETLPTAGGGGNTGAQ